MRKRSLLIIVVLLLTVFGGASMMAQSDETFKVGKIRPYDRGVPGQILNLELEGLGGAPNAVMLDAGDFRIDITQDGD